jgi:aryl-alcohol dehydrogenase-like predicted oxidoreductase
MHYTTLGRTGLRVSVAGLGTGGFSRLGLRAGKTEDEAAQLIHEAVDLGVNVIDTATGYGTEGVVGKALKTIREHEAGRSLRATSLLARTPR